MILSETQIEVLRVRFEGWYAIGGAPLVKSKLPLYSAPRKYQLECMLEEKSIVDIIVDKPVAKADKVKAPYEIKKTLGNE